MNNKRKVKGNSLLPIVRDGAIATPEWGDGRLIPVLVVDCSNRPEVRDLIYAHEHLPPGDVKVTWGRRLYQKRTVFLLLEFQRPSDITAVIEFDVTEQGGLVDGILHAHGVYLQPLESGAKVIEGINKGKILVEVPDTGFMPKWTEIYSRRLLKKFRKNGLARAEADRATEEHIKRIREIWRLRMNRSGGA
jgi:hypothetical protein